MINRGKRGQRLQASDWNKLVEAANRPINLTADNSIQVQQFGNQINLSQPIHEFDAIIGDSFQQDNDVWAHSWQIATPNGDGTWMTGPSFGNGDAETTPAYAYNGTSASSGTPVRMYAGSQNEFYFTNGGSGGGTGTPMRVLLDYNCENNKIQKTYACILAERTPEPNDCFTGNGLCDLFDFFPSQYRIEFPELTFALNKLRASSSESSSFDSSSSETSSSDTSSSESSSTSSSTSSSSSSCSLCDLLSDKTFILND